MHDIDRTFMEYTPEMTAFESENFEFDAGEWSGESGEVFNETQVMELAAELLEVHSEQELNHFLGSFIGRAASAVGSAIRSPVGQALGGVLKNAAKQALPIVGGAIGGHFGGDTGTKWGERIGAGAGQLLGLETEGLSHEDESFELAKQYVRFAADTVKNAAKAPAGDPRALVQTAANQAAQRFAPGLVAGAARSPVAGAAPRTSVAGRSGRWIRRGNRIVLYGV